LATVAKVCIGGNEPLFCKDAAGEAELGLSGQVEHRNDDGDVRKLSPERELDFRPVVFGQPLDSEFE
jgi:hypothetical protein